MLLCVFICLFVYLCLFHFQNLIWISDVACIWLIHACKRIYMRVRIWVDRRHISAVFGHILCGRIRWNFSIRILNKTKMILYPNSQKQNKNNKIYTILLSIFQLLRDQCEFNRNKNEFFASLKTLNISTRML